MKSHRCPPVKACLAGIFAFLLIPLSSTRLLAQNKDEPYRIGPSDVLAITFWQEPDLNSQARVTESGTITLPVIGELTAAGLTTTELAKKIVEQMAFYQTPVSQATVVVTEYNFRSVVVSGQVSNPSTQSYEKIPDLWRVIINAGGPTDQADLSRVTIIRKEDGKSRTIETDLLRIINDGDLSAAPALQPGDLIHVPSTPFGTGMQIGETAEFEGRNVFFVLGAVNSPGVRNLDPGIDVLEAITLAGGATPEADLENVRLVMKGQKYSNIVRVDLKSYIDGGKPPRLLLHPEDAIYIPLRRQDTFGIIMGRVGAIIPVVGAIGTIVLLAR